GSDSSKSDKARTVGSLVGERAKAAGIDSVVFDRGGYKYNGRVAAVAEGAREAGLALSSPPGHRTRRGSEYGCTAAEQRSRGLRPAGRHHQQQQCPRWPPGRRARWPPGPRPRQDAEKSAFLE